MFAGFRRLDNLVVIVDNNGLQIDGPVDQVSSPYPIGEKFKAFNFHVIDLKDGNDMDQIADAFKEAKKYKGYADGNYSTYRKGQGCFIYGKSGRLAWQGS